jgi:CheY-like chemotaxis protein
MRSIALQYESSSTLSEAIGLSPRGAACLPLPAADAVVEGEWVLARVETDADRRCMAAAAVGRRIGDHVVLCFGPLDWERITNLTAPPSSRPTPPTPASLPPTLEPIEDAPPNSLRTPGLRIALVDNDPTTRAELLDTLSSQGLDVVAFENADAALAERGPLHAAVVSYGLPGGGAGDLAKKMREAHPSGLPVLFVSSHRCSREIVEAYACGCDDYLARPFRSGELGARVLGLLRRSADAYR